MSDVDLMSLRLEANEGTLSLDGMLDGGQTWRVCGQNAGVTQDFALLRRLKVTWYCIRTDNKDKTLE